MILPNLLALLTWTPVLGFFILVSSIIGTAIHYNPYFWLPIAVVGFFLLFGGAILCMIITYKGWLHE